MDGTPRRRAIARALKRCALIGATLTLVAPAAASALPRQGLYDQCSPALSGDACASHLEQMRQGGFTAVLNYTAWDATPEQLQAFADGAAARGMQVIWPLNHPVWRTNGDITKVYRKLAAACECQTADQLLAYVTSLVAGHSATWGFYVGDELPATEVPAVNALIARVKALAPGARTLYIALERGLSNGDNLAPFGATADVVGADSYPFGTGADATAEAQLVAQITRKVVAPGRERAMVLQAFDWHQHAEEVGNVPGGFPDVNAMRIARDAAITHADPSLLLWYSFNDIQSSDDPARHWADLVAAANAPAPTAAATRSVAPSSTAATTTTTKKSAAKKSKKSKKAKKARKSAKKAKKSAKKKSSKTRKATTRKAKTRKAKAAKH